MTAAPLRKHQARPEPLAGVTLERFRAVRASTERLAERLSPEDCALQSMPDASPVKWHLGHTTWFFETMVLERAEAGFRPMRPEFRSLFNSYYVSVGPRHPRPQRGMLSRDRKSTRLNSSHSSVSRMPSSA